MIAFFDFHTHIFPDKIARKTVDQLGDHAGLTPAFAGSRDGLIDCMRQAGIDAALNCPIATRPEQARSINRWAADCATWPVFSLGTVHPDSPHLADELQEVRDLGLPGIKLHPEYQDFHPNEERLFPLYEACIARNLFVQMHCGEDIGFSPPYHSSPAAISEVLQRFPDLTLVGAHMGGWRLWNEVESELCGCPNLYLDTSFTLDCTSPEHFVRLIRKHGADRVLFGTDAPWRVPREALAAVRATALEEAELRLILRDNALALLGRYGLTVEPPA